MSGESPDDVAGSEGGDQDHAATGQSERLDALAEHLAATAELPVERTAAALLGEAEAVASDLAADSDAVAPDVLRTRLHHVRDLLDRIETTESEQADEHLVAARSLTASLLEDSDAEPDASAD
jgi:hypothetical protein